MDNQNRQDQASRFKLGQSPVAVQITVHVQNLIIQYGPNITREFKSVLMESYESDLALDSNFRIDQLIGHYGFEVVRQWFTDIYGWTYENAA